MKEKILKDKKYKIKGVKSVSVSIDTDRGREKAVTKNPLAIITSILKTEKRKDAIKAEIHLVGKGTEVLLAYCILTEKLVASYGEERVIKTLLFLFKGKVKQAMALMAPGQKGRTVH